MAGMIDIFISYAHEDEKLRKQLEKQLSVFKRAGIVTIWHDRNIRAGQEREAVISAHLDTAHIILLLISPDFMDSQQCYHVEMKRALERHERGEVKIIPILLRPVDWSLAPFHKLQVLPIDGKPITAWRSRDEAFSSVATAIHEAIGELKEKPCSSELPGTPSQRKLLLVSQSTAEAKQPSVLEPLSKSEGKRHGQPLFRFSRRNTLTVLAGLIIATGGGVPLLRWIGTQARRTSRTSTLSPDVQDQNLAVQFIGTQQNTLPLLGDPLRLSTNQLPKQGIPALCIDQQKQQAVFRVTIGISNLRQDQYVLLIEQIQIIVEHIASIPHPLYVLVQSLPVLFNYNLYRAPYRGQDPNTSIPAKYDNPPYDYVFLTLHETDKISVEVASSVEVFLSFRVAITYRVANEGQTHTLTLPNIFQVIFTDKSNWHPYEIRNGHFVQLDTP